MRYIYLFISVFLSAFLSGCSQQYQKVEIQEDSVSLLRNPCMGWGVYDDANDEAEQSKSDMEIDDDEDAREPDDFDSIDNSDNYIDDDNDDDLADLTIVNDDDLEE